MTRVGLRRDRRVLRAGLRAVDALLPRRVEHRRARAAAGDDPAAQPLAGPRDPGGHQRGFS